MLVSKAYAQAVEISSTTSTAVPPTAMESVMWNMGVVLVLVILFYVMLIRPQQRRFREHSEMLAGLKKGDKVIVGGGLIGTIEKITDGDQDVTVDLGNGVKVTAVRSALQGAVSPLLKGAAASGAAEAKTKASNDSASKKTDSTTEKKAPAAKKEAKKK
jgi:preprotein translocase subunit YajC